MTNQEDFERFFKKAEKVRKEVCKSKKAARELLFSTGMYDKNGNLKKEFCMSKNNLRGHNELCAVLDDIDYEKPEQSKKKFRIFPLPLQWWVNDCCSDGKNMCKTTWWDVLTGKHKGQKKFLGRP